MLDSEDYEKSNDLLDEFGTVGESLSEKVQNLIETVTEINEIMEKQTATIAGLIQQVQGVGAVTFGKN